MILKDFEFIKADKLDDVLLLLSDNVKKVKILSGGTDIIPGLVQGSSRFKDFDTLIDISSVPELKSVKENNNSVLVGTGLTFSEIIEHPILQKEFPLLCKASERVGSLQIRNRATVGGNIVNNAPCADSLSPLLCYDASLIIQSKNLQKQIKLKDFLGASYNTLLSKDELVLYLQIPKLNSGYTGDFYKLGRRRGVAISRISLSALIKTERNIIKDFRIAAGAVTPVAMRFDKVERYCVGKTVSIELLISVSQMVGKTVLEITGLRWSSDYKLPVLQQSLYQLLRKVLYGRGKDD